MVTRLFQWRAEKKISNKKPLQAMLCMIIENQSVTPWSVELLPVLWSEKNGWISNMYVWIRDGRGSLFFSRGGAGQGQKSMGQGKKPPLLTVRVKSVFASISMVKIRDARGSLFLLRGGAGQRKKYRHFWPIGSRADQKTMRTSCLGVFPLCGYKNFYWLL